MSYNDQQQYPNQQGQYSSAQYDDDVDTRQYPETPQYIPTEGFVQASRKNDNFLQWFLSLREGITELKLTWRGWERDETGSWMKTKSSEQYRVMNEIGIHWAVGLMNSYLTKVAQATNWDEDHMSYQMRIAARVIWFTLAVRYKEFNLSKTNAVVIGDTVFFQIHSMLLAARGEGIRKFIQTTQSVTEHKIMNDQQNQSAFAGLKSLFGGQQSGN